jgi:hypothetical protein
MKWLPLCLVFLGSPAFAAVGYTVLNPIAGDNYARIAKALAGPLPVQLAPSATMSDFAVSQPIAVGTNQTLVCENTHDDSAGNFGGGGYGGEGTVRVLPMAGFSGDAVIKLSGSDAEVRGCSVNMDLVPGLIGHCFKAVDGSFGAVFDSIGAFFCKGSGLDMTPNGSNTGFVRVTGRSAFFNSTGPAISLYWDPNGGSGSDTAIDGATVGSNCKGGCDGDIFLYGTNGFVRNMRVEWSNDTGMTCFNCSQMLWANNYFDRTGGAAMAVVGSSYVTISGGLILGAGRATPSEGAYTGAAVKILADNANTPYVNSTVAVNQWGPNASYYFTDTTPNGSFLVDRNGVQPTPYGIWADQASHDALAPLTISPPAFPQ